MAEENARTVEKLFARHRREGVLLHLPYPPQAAPRTNSKFGGLPRLPEQYEWPRMPSGVPFHFFAQIDCAELPLKSALPARGVLFFFGRSDDGQVWYADRPQDACRVLYVQDAFALTPPRAAPDDLPPIGGRHPPPFARPFVRDGEAGPNLYTEWPIQPRTFSSWPDSSGIYQSIQAPFDWNRFNPARLFKSSLRSWLESQDAIDDMLDEYDEALARKRADEYYRVTQAPLPVPEEQWNGYGTATALRLYHEDGAPDAFPQLWAHIDFFCRAATAYVAKGRAGFDDAPAMAATAEEWLDRAKARLPTDPVADTDRAAFRAWNASLREPESPAAFNSSAATFIIEASLAAIRAFAGDPARAALISPAAYDVVAPLFHGHSTGGPSFSQMLGHAPSAQEALSVKDPTVCLLSLASDAAIGWMFGDVGECTFWIKPDDLARRDFSRVWGTIEGH